MDQIKIGKFIAECRKKQNLTQAQLAEKLNVTDRAVSKWETGKSMPDSSIMLELCDILKINANDLLTGEVVSMENYNKQLEENLIEMVKQKEESDKRLLKMEILTGVLSIIPLLAAVIVVMVVPMQEWLGSLIAGLSVLPLLIATPFMIKIEQSAGYYQCAECGHKHIPKYSHVFLAMHMGRTRYMRCPKCNKNSWQKKVISKE
jgi:transcriptional regulator with XRE-family HTH domain/DNA-directed RNA polymerase subunit RPC12/RpoP